MPLHPAHQTEASRYLSVAAVLLLALIGFRFILPLFDGASLPGHVFAHAALETVAITIAGMIAALGFSLPQGTSTRSVCQLSTLFLGVAILDFMHLMTSVDMPGLLRPGNVHDGIIFWFAARTLALCAILLPALRGWPTQRCNHWKRSLSITLSAVLAIVALLTVKPGLIPDTYLPDTGLTTFKISYEYLLMGGYLLAALLFYRQMRHDRRFNASGLCAAALVMAMSEYFFTLYAHATDGFHLVGHIYKVIAYLFLYRAVFSETVSSPYLALQESQLQLQETVNKLSQSRHEQLAMDARLRVLSLVVEQSPNPMLITDHAGKIEYVNEAFLRTSGYTATEVVGQNPRFIQSGKTPSTTYKAMWTLLSRGETWKGEVINRRKNGEEYTEKLLIYPIKNQRGEVTHYLSHKEDITEQKAAAARIRELSHFDQLTGLPNQVSLRASLRHTIDLSHHHNDPFTLMTLNIDNFRVINESLGLAAGDDVLRQTAKRLLECATDKDTVARLSGDLFVLIFPGMDEGQAALKAIEILETIQHPIQVLENHHSLIATASIGIALFPNDGAGSEALLASSEAAMHHAKLEGKNNFRFFTPVLQQSSLRILELGVALKTAAANNELRLVYQPQLNLHTGKVDGAEALIRWRHPELGEIGPAEFIPIAEQYGMITELGDWILETALTQTHQWRKSGLGALILAINLSATQFNQPGLAHNIMALVRKTGADPFLLELELTEAVAMKHPEQAREIMDSLSKEGFRLSIDDFGTGYSSLSYLKRFSVEKLKIDRSFVNDISVSADDRAIVQAIVQMAHSLGMTTIAEGVETEDQLAMLRAKGCDAIQGYLFCRPLEADAFEQFVRAHNG